MRKRLGGPGWRNDGWGQVGGPSRLPAPKGSAPRPQAVRPGKVGAVSVPTRPVWFPDPSAACRGWWADPETGEIVDPGTLPDIAAAWVKLSSVLGRPLTEAERNEVVAVVSQWLVANPQVPLSERAWAAMGRGMPERFEAMRQAELERAHRVQGQSLRHVAALGLVSPHTFHNSDYRRRRGCVSWATMPDEFKRFRQAFQNEMDGRKWPFFLSELISAGVVRWEYWQGSSRTFGPHTGRYEYQLSRDEWDVFEAVATECARASGIEVSFRVNDPGVVAFDYGREFSEPSGEDGRDDLNARADAAIAAAVAWSAKRLR